MGLNPEYANLYGFDYAGPVVSRDEFADGGDRAVMTLTDQAIEFISKSRDQPWFCFLSHHMIHSDVVAPDDIAREYRNRGFGDLGPNRAIYLAGLDIIDRSVGRLIRALEEFGEIEETMIVFLADNGGVDEDETADREGFGGDEADIGGSLAGHSDLLLERLALRAWWGPG